MLKSQGTRGKNRQRKKERKRQIYEGIKCDCMPTQIELTCHRERQGLWEGDRIRSSLTKPKTSRVLRTIVSNVCDAQQKTCRKSFG